MRRTSILFIILILFIFSFSCEKGNFSFDVNCADCYKSKPDSADILVRLTFNDLNPNVPLTIYKGKIDKNVLEWVDTAYVDTYPNGEYLLLSPVNEYYSVKATYNTKSGKTIVAVDGDDFVTKHITDACDTDCWIIKGGVLDVRLKYD